MYYYCLSIELPDKKKKKRAMLPLWITELERVQGWLASVIHKILFQQQQPPEDGREKRGAFSTPEHRGAF